MLKLALGRPPGFEWEEHFGERPRRCWIGLYVRQHHEDPVSPRGLIARALTHLRCADSRRGACFAS